MKNLLERMMGAALDALRDGAAEALDEVQGKLNEGRDECPRCKSKNTRRVTSGAASFVCLTCATTTTAAADVRVVQGKPQR